MEKLEEARALGILVEHYKGNFPVWLAPTQIIILPISNKHNLYAQKVLQQIQALGIRSELDKSSSTIRYKVREAETRKIPYMAVCGKVEENSNTVSIRKHGVGNLGSYTIDGICREIRKDNAYSV